ncbi:omega-hydroxypalmitate O-feruloyl transferase-like [Melia azedarach]|uniref:Omega-hydroxypalmitate O-feruloyl transferase-like n=1 Tax=Melia azedarach TaxID=155640 RepID=A0ACC1WUM1_MELAZ|nr:omega-hydroxypalmitate O-feruloyl transferase-like [Melia azedarach]
MDMSAEEFLELSRKPNRSWRKLLYGVEANSFLDIPPLVVQVTYLRCGGMILCTAINHCLCDGIGTSQFLHAWAHMTAKPNLDLPILPFHTRHVLKPRNPPQVTFAHHGYTKITQKEIAQVEINQYLQSQPLVPASLTFTASHVLRLKRNCVPSLKCTTFEALASHTWRSWVRSLDLSPSLNVKLLFSVNVRKKLNPELPQGYYGNGFVLGCAETGANDLVNSNLYHTIKLVQHAKSSLTDDYVRSMVDLLEDKNYKTDLSASLVISQWSKLGLEDLDFGEGKPLHMGPVTSDIYCLFLPVIGDSNSMRVLVSMPENVVERFVFYMTAEFLDGEEKENNNNN